MATKFITVSIEIMHDKKLSPNQKFILAEIEQLNSLDKGCIGSNKHFAELIGITPQGVSKAIHDLENKGYIKIDNAQTKRNFGRIITINSGKSAINSGLESKENKTITCRDGNNLTSDVKTVIDYLNLTANKKYKPSTLGTILIIQARLNQGYEVEDLKKVVDNKTKEWLNDDKMNTYLRPETLFNATKFESYLFQESIQDKKFTPSSELKVI